VQVLLGESEADAAEAAFLRGFGYRSLLMVPVVHRGATTGLLEALSSANTPWSRTSINRARIIAYQLGAVLATLTEPPAPSPPDGALRSGTSSAAAARAGT
jgi:GAF domain-containing protein